jgi:hypothetical protein
MPTVGDYPAPVVVGNDVPLAVHAAIDRHPTLGVDGANLAIFANGDGVATSSSTV